MKCPGCGSDITDPEAKFCRRCGRPFGAPTVVSATGIVCTQCGTQNHSGARFCRGCGASLTGADSGTPPDEAAEETRACPNCGTENPVSRRFCKSCGCDMNQCADTAATATTEDDMEDVPEPPSPTVPPATSAESASATTDALRDEPAPKPIGEPPGATAVAKPIPSSGARWWVAAIVAAVVLAGGIGGYFWMHKPPPAAASTPEQPAAAPSTRAPGPAVAHSQPARPVTEASTPGPKPAPKPPTSHPAGRTESRAVPRREATPARKPAEAAPTEHASPPPAAAPASVADVIARRCANAGNLFERKFCEEKARWSLCEGKWGKEPGCPKPNDQSVSPFSN